MCLKVLLNIMKKLTYNVEIDLTKL